MRSRLDEQLEYLNTELISMGALCETMIDKALRALFNHDLELAADTASMDSLVNHKERDIENLCLKLLLQQQPVASDLRQISSALKMITDMERIGDQAEDISEIVLVGNTAAMDNIEEVEQMAIAVKKMMVESIDAFVKKDLALAEKVIDADDEVDYLFDQVKEKLILLIRENIPLSEGAIDILMIAKYLERIGDHTTNIAEWVEYSLTGHHRKQI